MKGPIGLPWKKYLVASIVEFDKKKLGKQRKLSTLGLIPFVLLPIAQLVNVDLISMASFAITIIIFPIGIWSLFSAKTYNRKGLLELTEDGFSISLNENENKYYWSDIGEGYLIYLTDYEGFHKPTISQVKRCFLAFENENNKMLVDYVLNHHDMSMAIHKLSKSIAEKYSNITVINAYGMKREKEIKKIRTDFCDV